MRSQAREGKCSDRLPPLPLRSLLLMLRSLLLPLLPLLLLLLSLLLL
jgi:hypothetical protein